MFRTSSSLKSSLSKQDLHNKLKGQHFKVHDLDFEVMEREGLLKIIPHTEYADEKIYTLPITHLKFKEIPTGTKVTIKSKPRRIDIGGPQISLTFILFLIIAGASFYFSNNIQYRTASLSIMIVGLILLVIFGIRMNQGYYDYIRKIKAWVKSQI